MSTFTFDGVCCDEFDFVVSSGAGTYAAPSRDLEHVTIPGRDSTLLIDNGRWGNVSVKYPGFIVKNVLENTQRLRAFLASRSKGYYRLEDTYHPNEFRVAALNGAIEPAVALGNQVSSFSINFTAKPQRYLYEGLQEHEFTQESNTRTLSNPTLFASQPLIRVFGYGQIVVGGKAVNIEHYTDENVNYIDLDCDVMEAYCGSINCNKYVSLPDDWPTIPPGNTEVVMDETITRIVVTPRWWTL